MNLDPDKLNQCKIFLAHVQKTAGAAINNAFLNLGKPVPKYWDSEFVEDIEKEEEIPPYAQIVIAKDHLLERDGVIYKGWATDLLAGEFFYAFSHQCIDDVRLPDGAFVFTVLRDPVERVISHYSELEGWHRLGLDYDYSAGGSDWKTWMEGGFSGYLEAIPPTELMNHLYVYGGLLQPERALARLDMMDSVLFNDHLEAGFERLCKRLELRMELPRIRVQKYRYRPNSEETEQLETIIAPELAFYRAARQRYCGSLPEIRNA